MFSLDPVFDVFYAIAAVEYEKRLNSLFSLLSFANTADSDASELWMHPNDSMLIEGTLYYHIRCAIVAIAGEAIVEHWAKTGEVDTSLADRQLGEIVRERLNNNS